MSLRGRRSAPPARAEAVGADNTRLCRIVPESARHRLDDVLRAGLATNALFIQTDGTIAERSKEEHRKAMAVLAYNNGWDTIINEHMSATANPPIFTLEAALELVPMVAFFAPLEPLQDVLWDVLSLRSFRDWSKGWKSLAKS